MDASTIQRLYLRALYTGIAEPIGSDEQRILLAHMAIKRLPVEQAARIRNLRTVLHNDMRLLNRVLDKGELLPYVREYACSDLFWMHRGRSLIEDFCLHFVQFSNASPVFKLIARIEGVYSGLSTSVRSDSPWPTHVTSHDGDVTSECFAAPFALSFETLFNKPSSYQPHARDVNCVVQRHEQAIHVKFHNATTCKQSA
ncbi:hypothetical protein FPJ27_15720 [Burkholderia sp. MS455]|uniref:hypothetical protein n=1 Tax=Burkholderia sp. MS455 TaxID=2811788 RepID=UPI00195C2CCC|nr:hypothetical protein [Burkholderia sp. MS455]QRR07700.1 hypothetical protein FPJ27_15720 [Burkholderia sp. MS455]